MKLKFLSLAVAAFMTIGMLSGCESSQKSKNAAENNTNQTDEQNSDSDKSDDNNDSSDDGQTGYDKVVVGLDDTFAPMGFRDENNELTGFDVELAKAVGEVIGVEVEFQPINWDTKETELNNGTVDLLWNGYTINEKRKEQVLFTRPYLNNRQIVLVLDSSDIQTLDDLGGKTVATQAGSSSEEAILSKEGLKDSFGEYVTFGTYDECLMDQEAGRTDAVVADEVLIRFYISNHPDTQYRILDEHIADEEYGIGARKDDTALVEAINGALDELKENGKGAEISEKWFSEDILL
ncbi:MAG: amino acid ABC transporter substrate-binding protein [Firmicutes bacterium]|nr:amino acid ABC transporter substrate-binding protein [Bacillota bacterium]